MEGVNNEFVSSQDEYEIARLNAKCRGLQYEHEAAKAEIERLFKQASIFNGRFAEDQLQLAAKDAEIERLNNSFIDLAEWRAADIAARDLVIKQMLEVLLKAISSCFDRQSYERHMSDPSYFTNQALSLQPTSEALDAYVKARMDEMSRAAYPHLYKENPK